MSDTDEHAKAMQEASKLGREIVGKLGDLERIGKQLLGPFGEGYGILTDLVRHKREEIHWRLHNRMAIYRMALERANSLGMDIDKLEPVPKRVAYDYEDGLEREDDPKLQDLWANLLINVTRSDSNIRPEKVFKDILSRLEGDDAVFLNEIGLREHSVSAWFIVCEAVPEGCQIDAIPYASAERPLLSTDLFVYSEVDGSYYTKWSEYKVNATVDKLVSLGLMYWNTRLHLAQEIFENEERAYPSKDYAELGSRMLQHAEGVRVFEMSDLGKAFLNAVRPPT